MTARLLDSHISEKAFQSQIRQLCELLGLLCYCTFDSRRSPAGYPDLCVCNPRTGDVIWLELKSSRGVVSAAQRTWLEALGKKHAVHVLRPADIELAEIVLFALAGRRRP